MFRSRKPPARDAGPTQIHVYWPDVAWVFDGDGRARHEYTNEEIDALVGADEWRQIETAGRLPLAYGDGRCHIAHYQGRAFLVLTGAEYGSSAAEIPPEAALLLQAQAEATT